MSMATASHVSSVVMMRIAIHFTPLGLLQYPPPLGVHRLQSGEAQVATIAPATGKQPGSLGWGTSEMVSLSLCPNYSSTPNHKLKKQTYHSPRSTRPTIYIDQPNRPTQPTKQTDQPHQPKPTDRPTTPAQSNNPAETAVRVYSLPRHRRRQRRRQKSRNPRNLIQPHTPTQRRPRRRLQPHFVETRDPPCGHRSDGAGAETVDANPSRADGVSRGGSP